MLEQRQPASELTIHGATLTPSTMGGYSVTIATEYIGYVLRAGDSYNAYSKRRNQIDDHLGLFNLDDAVEHILRAAGRTPPATPSP